MGYDHLWEGAAITHTHKTRSAALLVCMLSLVAAAGPTTASEAWVPGVGRLDLEASEDQVTDALRAAYGDIVGAKPERGVKALRGLIEKHPAAPWVPRARRVLAAGLIRTGRCRDAFRALERLTELGRDAPAGVFALQLRAAACVAADDIDRAARLYERLLAAAESSERRERVLKEQGDARLRAGRYLEAELSYTSLLRENPRSSLRGYCYFRVAQARAKLAHWLDTGVEIYMQADREYAAFLEGFPESQFADAARAERQAVRERAARWHLRNARLYAWRRGHVAAARDVLEYVTEEFARTTAAQEARAMLAKLATSGEKTEP
jgi:outer membrane protein assembly factor BamD (BamD/ComL family)